MSQSEGGGNDKDTQIASLKAVIAGLKNDDEKDKQIESLQAVISKLKNEVRILSYTTKNLKEEVRIQLNGAEMVSNTLRRQLELAENEFIDPITQTPCKGDICYFPVGALCSKESLSQTKESTNRDPYDPRESLEGWNPVRIPALNNLQKIISEISHTVELQGACRIFNDEPRLHNIMNRRRFSPTWMAQVQRNNIGEDIALRREITPVYVPDGVIPEFARSYYNWVEMEPQGGSDLAGSNPNGSRSPSPEVEVEGGYNLAGSQSPPPDVVRGMTFDHIFECASRVPLLLYGSPQSPHHE